MAAGLARCPSLRQNSASLGRASSFQAPRRAASLAASGRRLSVDCRAQRPAADEPEQLPEPSTLRWELSQLPQATNLHAEEWSWEGAQAADEDDAWEMDAAMMPWIAGQALPEPEKDNAGRNPVVFHPDVTDLGPDMLNEELKQYVDKMVTRERNAACFVILFGLGVEDTEGIYTLRTVDCSSEGDIINMDTVVAFEEEVDALRFATLLEASLEHVPSVFPTSWGEITDWCEENNTRCRLEPGGSLLIPPESNVTMTDWERALALQRGDYKVLDEEPALGTSAVAEAESTPLAPGFFIDGPDWVYDHEDALDVSNIVDSKLADSSIASIREDLERLLNH